MEKKNTKNKERRRCPYCEEEMFAASSPLCGACGVALNYCPKCKMVIFDKEAIVCPGCGGPLRRGGKKQAESCC